MQLKKIKITRRTLFIFRNNQKDQLTHKDTTEPTTTMATTSLTGFGFGNQYGYK